MFDNTQSLFRCVAIGIAVENKVLGDKSLKVTPHEKFPFMDGELAARVDTMEYNTTDKDGKATGGTAFVSNDITARWLPESNRLTAPDIQRGERVSLWQYANNDKYYWRSMGLDDYLRRLETVIWGINANPNAKKKSQGDVGNDFEFDPDDMYFVEFSSHSKMVTFSTSKKNGEFCAYDFQFDMANGKVVLQDDLGNFQFLDSKNTHLKMQNMLGTYFELNKQNMRGYAPQNIDFECGNQFKVKSKVAIIDGGGSVMTLTAPVTTLKTPFFKGSS